MNEITSLLPYVLEENVKLSESWSDVAATAKAKNEPSGCILDPLETGSVDARNESVLMQVAQCWFHGRPFPMLKYKYIFQIKYPGAILSNSTR